MKLVSSRKEKEKRAKAPSLLTRFLTLLVTAALVVGALILVIFHDRLNIDSLKRFLTYRSLETSDSGEAVPFTHAGGDKLSLAYLDSGVLQTSVSGSHYYSFSGELFAEEVQAMENPVLSATRKAGVVYDAGGQSLYMYQDGVETFKLNLDGNADLLSARINEAGWLAVTAQQSGYKGAVTVYNELGSEVIQIKLSSTFVVDAAISPDSKTVAVVTMDQKGGSFSSKVLLYPVNKKEPKATFDLGNTVVLDLDYEAGRLWVLGEDRLSIVPVRGGDVTTYSFGHSYLKGCDFGGDGFALLLLGRYRSGGASQVLTIGPDGQSIAASAPGGQVLDFDSAGGYCSLLTGTSLNIYNKNLEPYATLDITQGARYSALAPDGSALLANDQRAWLFIPG